MAFSPIALKKVKAAQNPSTEKSMKRDAGKDSILLSVFIVAIGAVVFRLG